MYDIRQFRPLLYVLLVVGIGGFALAAQLPGIWLLAVAFVGLNAWLNAIGRFKPISRLWANVITILSALYVIHELVNAPAAPVVTIGEFLVFLQLVKLWEYRANRDYAQLLILSLLLMVASSMNTASLWFAILLIVYLLLSLYCCLLFHLKVETDLAKAAMPIPEEKISPGVLRQDQRHLSNSMRRLTGLVSIVSLGSAVLVFLFFPRGTGAGFLGPLQSFRSATSLTGFAEQVAFQDVARITQNHETIAFVKVWHNNKLVNGNQTLLLRGLTLDAYRHSEIRREWEWTRSNPPEHFKEASADDPLRLPADSRERWRQQIALLPTHTDVLFALAGPVFFAPRQKMKVRYYDDGVLQATSARNDRTDYEVISTNQLGDANNPAEFRPALLLRQEFPRIFDFARRTEVCGSDGKGSLGDQRRVVGGVNAMDRTIASNIQRYLQSHYIYTLDLTDASRLQDRNPLEAFLFDWKKGHCEYFAGAMTLMCQTLGLQARMVIGFKCDGSEYNNLNDQYTVHDSDAHAWVEVRTPEGWESFDPTSSNEATDQASTGWTGQVRHVVEFLEFSYANAVIAYDQQNRKSVIASVETGMASAAGKASKVLGELRRFIFDEHPAGFWSASTVLLLCLTLLMLVIVLGSVGWFLWECAMLRRRAVRIGIESLPEEEQLRLARQLGFYDDLITLLGEHHIVRPRHYTPMEFSQSLAFLPAEAYDTIQRLTQLFYRIRYGGEQLPSIGRRRLGNVLARLSGTLNQLSNQGPSFFI